MKKIYLLSTLFALLNLLASGQTVDIVSPPGTSPNVVVGLSNYHVSESIYTEEEIGAGNFITAASAIQKLNFFTNALGAPTAINSYSIYMKNVPLATTTLATGTYSTAGYTLVFNGTYNATPLGLSGVTLTTPFVRTAGTNLTILIIRADNVLHPGYNFNCAVGNTVGGVTNNAALSSRRYNGTTDPFAPTTLTATNFRPAIELIHTFPIDASVTNIVFPIVSCYTTPQTVKVYVQNDGTSNIAAGAAVTTLHVRGANTFTGTLANTATILPGAFEIINFTGVNLNNTGTNLDTAYVSLAGDSYRDSDTLSTSNTTAPVLSTYPITEDAETTLPVFPYIQTIALGQLWRLQTGNYTNADQTSPLVPRAPGTKFYLFDSYSGAGSLGYQSRLFSNCLAIPPASALPLLSFWMSHDNIFPNDLDSLYVSVSVDKGQTWTRLVPGYQRPDAAALTPTWKIETISLAAYANQTIQIGFEGVSKYGNAFGLDDITLSRTIPVSLLSFDAQRVGKVNNLSWSTSDEQNSNKFIVEHSIDGRNFSGIGVVAAAGNSSSRRDYRFTDLHPQKGMNYYRLRSVDLNDAFKYSNIRNVKNSDAAELSFAPNPVQSTLKVQLNAIATDKGTMTITDMSGKQVYNGVISVVAGNNMILVDADHFPQGSYIVKIQLSGENIVKKFNKL